MVLVGGGSEAPTNQQHRINHLEVHGSVFEATNIIRIHINIDSDFMKHPIGNSTNNRVIIPYLVVGTVSYRMFHKVGINVNFT